MLNERPFLVGDCCRIETGGILVEGWYHMIPESRRFLAPAFGLHASLLPGYSGYAPCVWATINGESKIGITIFQMDSGVDSKPILGQKRRADFPDDTIVTLYPLILEREPEILRETLLQLIRG